MGDLNSEISEERMNIFCNTYYIKCLVKEPTCFKNVNNPKNLYFFNTRRIKEKETERLKIQKGYQRIQERVKKLRQQFSEVVSNGRRSVSPKIILNNYELLMSIYGGCTATEPLRYGVEMEVDDESHGSSRNGTTQDLVDDDADDDADDADSDDPPERNNVPILEIAERNVTGTQKRKAACPTLIDNKRKQMEKSLSAAQRDKLLMTEYKNDIQNKKELLNVIREGNIAFTNAADKIGDAMNKMSDAFCRF